jgi:hypothetical protein
MKSYLGKENTGIPLYLTQISATLSYLTPTPLLEERGI